MASLKWRLSHFLTQFMSEDGQATQDQIMRRAEPTDAELKKLALRKSNIWNEIIKEIPSDITDNWVGMPKGYFDIQNMSKSADVLEHTTADLTGKIFHSLGGAQGTYGWVHVRQLTKEEVEKISTILANRGNGVKKASDRKNSILAQRLNLL